MLLVLGLSDDRNGIRFFLTCAKGDVSYIVETVVCPRRNCSKIRDSSALGATRIAARKKVCPLSQKTLWPQEIQGRNHPNKMDTGDETAPWLKRETTMFKANVIRLAVALMATSAVADEVTIGGDVTVEGTVEGAQTVVAIGTNIDAFGETGAIIGNVDIGGDADVKGRVGNAQTVVGIGTDIYVSGRVGVISSR